MVSVILPNYNHARFLKERIDSILNQTYENFEIIILDDCSTDDSRKIIDSYYEDPHISHIVYNETNSGSTFKQWDKGFALAKGEYIWIAESDDVAEPTFLAKLVPELDNNPDVVMSVSGINHIDENGEIIDLKCPVNFASKRKFKGNDFIKEFMSFRTSIYNASSVIFRKNILLDIDSIYKTYKSAGDYLFWIMLLEKGNIIIINERLDLFRRHSSAVTEKAFESGTDSEETHKIFRYLVQNKHIGYFKKHFIIGSRLLETEYRSFTNDKKKSECLEKWRNETFSPLFDKFIFRCRRRILGFFKMQDF